MNVVPPREEGTAEAGQQSEQGSSPISADDVEVDESSEVGLGAPHLGAALEALVLIADEPMPATALAEATASPLAEVEAELNRLAEEYTAQGKGFALRHVGGGWRFYTRDTCSEVVTRWVSDSQRARLSQAALETLAIIAYKQPITRARIAAVRGVNVDGVVRTLLGRGLVAETGVEPISQAALYTTTELFLERLGISDINDLPDIAALLPDIDDALDLFDSMTS